MRPLLLRTAEVALDVVNEVGEGPLWDPYRAALWWVDALRGDVHCLGATTGAHEVWHFPESVACLALHENGLLGLGMRQGFAAFSPEGGAWGLVVPVDDGWAGSRLNDGKCDARGRWWAGTMRDPAVAGQGALFRLDGAGTVTRVLDGATITNGLGWNPDCTLMYYIDSALGRVDMFDFDLDSATLRRRRPLVDIPTSVGTPDGLAVDAEGCIWVAIWGSGEVRCFSPDGRHVRSLLLPVTAVSSCAFGGPNLETLFVTSATYHEPESRLAREPHAGALFAADVGVRGLPVAALATEGWSATEA